MYAVVKTGGKQYKVRKDDILKIEKLDGVSGDKVELNEVLMVADGENLNMGKPLIQGAKVAAEIVGHGRGKKIRVLKFKRRKQYLKRQGHRQDFTQIKITDIAI